MLKPAIFLSVVMFSGGASADTLKVKSKIDYSDNATVPVKVKQECRLDTKLPLFLSKYDKSVELVDGKLGTKGRTLSVEITSVHAPGGGAWSGPKTMHIQGTLFDDGKKTSAFHGSRYSTGGAFGGFKGTCSIVGRNAKALAKDIARWLKSPVDGAALGDG